uniref:Uncharacterized protein AlNc14C101G6052 n=1 Tax=Albugo laibachii Nc14 TaxID=890382 RepID=F0WHI9_9STRA|nr:conserved hypothetical protein [Albugo laibachii Nc14]|eukprot:CCA20708.1 conserved hypothetical protein [Albugo laibachii Nc14]
MNLDLALKLVDYSDTSSDDEKQRMNADASLFTNRYSNASWKSPFVTREDRRARSVRKLAKKTHSFRVGTPQPATPQPSRIFPNLVSDHTKSGSTTYTRNGTHRPRDISSLFQATDSRPPCTPTQPHSHLQTPSSHTPPESHTFANINSKRSVYTPQPQTFANKCPFASAQKAFRAPNAPIKACSESKWEQAAFAMKLEENGCENEPESESAASTWGYTTPCKSIRHPWKLSSRSTETPKTPSKAKSKAQGHEASKNVDTLKSDFYEFHIEKPPVSASPFISRDKHSNTPIGISSNRKKAFRERFRELTLLERQKRRQEAAVSQTPPTSLDVPLASFTSPPPRHKNTLQSCGKSTQERPPDTIQGRTLYEYDWSFWKHLGNTAYSSANYEDAIRYYRQSVRALEGSLTLDHCLPQDRLLLKRDKGSLHANLSASLMMTSSLPEAKQEILYAIAMDPLQLRSYLRLARIQIMLGICEEARKTVSHMKALFWIESIQQDVRDPMATEKEASIGSEMEHREAISEIETSLQRYEEVCEKARHHQTIGSWSQAIYFWDQAIDIAPQDRHAHFEKTSALLHLRRFDDVFRMCVERLHQSKVYKLLDDLLDTPHTSEVLFDAIKVLGIEQSILWARALCYTNRSDEALRVLDVVGGMAPCCTKVHEFKRAWELLEERNEQGNTAFRGQDYVSAFRQYTDAIKIGDPFHYTKLATVYSNRAAAAMRLNRYEMGVSDCTDAMKLDPTHLRSLLRRARCYVHLEKYQLALSDFNAIVSKWSVQQEPSIGSKTDLLNERLDARRKLMQWEQAKKDQSANRSSRYSNRPNRNPSHASSRKNKNTRRFVHANQSRARKSSDQWWRPQNDEVVVTKRTHYEVLGVSRTASVTDIRKTYKKLALRYHPDKSNDPSCTEEFKEMTAAYNILSDMTARKMYDLDEGRMS